MLGVKFRCLKWKRWANTCIELNSNEMFFVCLFDIVYIVCLLWYLENHCLLFMSIDCFYLMIGYAVIPLPKVGFHNIWFPYTFQRGEFLLRQDVSHWCKVWRLKVVVRLGDPPNLKNYHPGPQRPGVSLRRFFCVFFVFQERGLTVKTAWSLAIHPFPTSFAMCK